MTILLKSGSPYIVYQPSRYNLYVDKTHFNFVITDHWSRVSSIGFEHTVYQDKHTQETYLIVRSADIDIA